MSWSRRSSGSKTMSEGDRVEHIKHRIRGEVLRYRGRFAEVIWDGGDSPTESGREFLRNVARSNENDGVYSLFSSVPVKMIRPVSAIDEMGDIVRRGVWPEEKDVGRGVVYVPYPGAQASIAQSTWARSVVRKRHRRR